MFNDLSFFNLSFFITIIPGAWVLWNYFFKRSFAPKIKMKLTGEIIDKDFSNQKMLKTNLEVSNVGEVRLKASKIELSVRGIEKNQRFKIGNEKILKQINFEKKIYQENLIPKKWEYTFVDPGVTQEYQHVILIPKKFKYLLIESKIFLNKTEDFQITSNILKIENEI